MSSSSTDPTPPPIPDYELIRLVGRGSYGDVWLAKSATGLFRAVKVVWRARFDDATPYEREFNGLREFARISAGESRQLALLHVGRNDERGFFYYVMELADDVVTGSDIDPDCYAPLTLKVLRDRDDFLPAAQVTRYGMDLAADLADLHSHGLIHRDIKPSNIIIVGGRPKLADIGLVAVANQALTYVGTEGFVPPEGPGTVSADIYSFGKVLYELATGRDRQDFPRLPENLGERDDRAELMELNEIIVKAAAPTPAQRYASAETLLGELQLLHAGKSVRRLRFAEAGLARARKWVLAAVAIAAVAGTGVYLERQRANTESAGRRAAEAELAELTRRTLYEASINNAQAALFAGDIADARQELAKSIPTPGEPDLRRFEWYALHNETVVPGVRTLRSSGEMVTSLVYSPDGSRLAAKDDSGLLSIYDLNTGELWRQHPGVHRLAGFTPDGSRLVGSTPDYELETWNVESGIPDPRPNRPGIHRPLKVAGNAPHLLYYRDSTTEAPHHIAVQDLETGEDLVAHAIPRHTEEGTWEFFNAFADTNLTRGHLKMMRGKNGFHQFRAWALPLGGDSEPAPVSSKLTPNIISWDYLREAPIVLETDGYYAVARKDPENGSVIWEHDLTGDTLDSYALSPDNRWLAIALISRQIQILDAVDGRLVGTHQRVSDRVKIFAWSPDSEKLALSSEAGDIQELPRIPADRSWRGIQANPINTGSTNALLLNPQQTTCLLNDRRGEGQILDLQAGTHLFSSPLLRDAVLFDGDEIWLLDSEQRLCRSTIAELKQGEVERIGAIDDRFFRVRSSPNGRWVAGATTEEELLLWDRQANRLTAKLPVPAGLLTLVVNNEGQIYASTLDQRVLHWNALTGRVRQSERFSERFLQLQVSPDERWLVGKLTSAGGMILRTDNFEVATKLDRVASNINIFSFHPDGTSLVLAGSNGRVRILDVVDWRERPSLVVDDPNSDYSKQTVRAVVFTPDGRSLLAPIRSGYLRIWRW